MKRQWKKGSLKAAALADEVKEEEVERCL